VINIPGNQLLSSRRSEKAGGGTWYQSRQKYLSLSPTPNRLRPTPFVRFEVCHSDQLDLRHNIANILSNGPNFLILLAWILMTQKVRE
jgi:hypothetical protein